MDAENKAQRKRVLAIMADGAERTLLQLCKEMGIPCLQTSVSMRLRELRQPKYGGWRVLKRSENGLTFYYRVLPPVPVAPEQVEMFGAAR